MTQINRASKTPKAVNTTTQASAETNSAAKATMRLTTPVYACVMLLTLAVSVSAQGTLMPSPKFTAFDNNGDPISGGKVCTYAAGTSTPATTYSDSGLTTPNANPVIVDSSGRASIYLSAGQSYKVVLRQPGTTTDCTTGTIVWTQDNVGAVPSSSSSLDVLGTAGESVTAGQVVYLSDGSGGLTAGQWYKADADLAYASTSSIVGIVPSAITAAATGTVRIGGTVTGLASLTVGSTYYVSQTAGGMTTTAPAPRVRVLGVAMSTTDLVMVGSLPLLDTSAEWRHLAQGRLTLESGVPVSTTDQSAKTTIYYTPYVGTSIGLYASSGWVLRTFAETSLSVATCTASKPYDVFAYDNAGTVALEMLVWTDATTRATALTTQNGVRVKNGDATRRYVGSFYCNASGGQTDDTAELRTVYSHDHQVTRVLSRVDTTASWSGTGASTWASARASAANRVAVMVGWIGGDLSLTARATFATNGSTATVKAGIGEDVTNAALAAGVLTLAGGAVGAAPNAHNSHAITRTPAVGYHVYHWIEWSDAALTILGGASPSASGLSGTIRQ